VGGDGDAALRAAVGGSRGAVARASKDDPTQVHARLLPLGVDPGRPSAHGEGSRNRTLPTERCATAQRRILGDGDDGVRGTALEAGAAV
jgi:hypothetical protein